MTATTTTVPPLTARDVLEHEGPLDLTSKLAGVKALEGTTLQVGTPGSTMWQAAYGALASSVATFLGVDVCEVLKKGWEQHDELLAAAQRTKSTEGSEPVNLGSRDVTLTQSPSVDVYLGEVHIATLAFELVIEILDISVYGIVADGRLIELTSGTCTAVVTLSLQGKEVATGRRPVHPNLELDLGHGLDLLAS